MYLTNKDLELLQKIEIELWNKQSTLYFDMWRLIEKKLTEREEKNKINTKRIAARRKIDPTYGRSQKELASRKKK